VQIGATWQGIIAKIKKLVRKINVWANLKNGNGLEPTTQWFEYLKWKVIKIATRKWTKNLGNF
jgi:hypothetical protein